MMVFDGGGDGVRVVASAVAQAERSAFGSVDERVTTCQSGAIGTRRQLLPASSAHNSFDSQGPSTPLPAHSSAATTQSRQRSGSVPSSSCVFDPDPSNPSQQQRYTSHTNCGLRSTASVRNPSRVARLPRTIQPGQAESDDLGGLGVGWMRVNGAFQQFRNVLSSAAKGVVKPPPEPLHATDAPPVPSSGRTCEDPAIALISIELGQFPKYTEEIGATGSAVGKTSGAGRRQQHSLTRQKTVVSSRLARRRDLFNRRSTVSDYAVFFAVLGILMMIMENELTAAEFYTKTSPYSVILKSLILLSTLVLCGLIMCFHILEIQLFMNDNSAEDWRIAMAPRRVAQICVEVVVCAICPFPGDLTFSWVTIHADGETVTTSDVPLDVVLSIPMFLRLYLVGRVMLLHSRFFTDASSRSIGALNRVNFNARFVLKTLMTLCPGTVLLVFTASLWIINAWVLRLCERYHAGDPPNPQALKHKNYLNSLWMIAITFLSVGYGDIVPNTYCGRTVAVITGIMGAGTASMVVAVIARKLELTRAEKHVHNFMMDTQLSKRLKHAAANVLRETWLIYKYRRLVDKINPSKIRMHQRKFLLAIYELRKVKRDQRKLAENSMTVGDLIKTSGNTYEIVMEMQTWQEDVDRRLTGMEQSLLSIRDQISQLSHLVLANHRTATQCQDSTGPSMVRRRTTVSAESDTSPHHY